jgi:hypothetical protein
MNKITRSIFAIALFVAIQPILAATIMPNLDEATALGTSETPQINKQDKTIDNAPNKKGMSKKDRMQKKLNTKKQKEEHTNSINNKPTGTINGVSNNGSTDDTRMGEPINGTTTGTTNHSETKVY